MSKMFIYKVIKMRPGKKLSSKKVKESGEMPKSFSEKERDEVVLANVVEKNTSSTIASEQGQNSAISPISKTSWEICGDAVTGLAHRRKNLPCQDSVAYCNAPRPILVLSDGAGSAAISERGSQALVIGIRRFLQTMEADLAAWLDEKNYKLNDQTESWTERIRCHAQGLLSDLASLERRNVRDVSATLQVVVIGEYGIFWWKVGDGFIVVRNKEGLKAIGNSQKIKGEFANQTSFVDSAGKQDIQSGILDAQEISGISLMSDGGAEKLVAYDGSRVSNSISDWLNDVAAQDFSIERITIAFHEKEMWERTNWDDRSIILAARPMLSDSKI